MEPRNVLTQHTILTEDPPPQSSSSSSAPNANADAALPPPDPPLRPLTSLKWPYVPEESAYPDPLKRDDPKPLQLHQYEAIGARHCMPIPYMFLCAHFAATSPAVRTALTTHPRLPALLRSLDALRGPAREDALQRALGVSAADVDGDAQAGPAALQEHTEEDVHALRVLAEAVEAAVRGGKGDVLGLDWGD